MVSHLLVESTQNEKFLIYYFSHHYNYTTHDLLLSISQNILRKKNSTEIKYFHAKHILFDKHNFSVFKTSNRWCWLRRQWTGSWGRAAPTSSGRRTMTPTRTGWPNWGLEFPEKKIQLTKYSEYVGNIQSIKRTSCRSSQINFRTIEIQAVSIQLTDALSNSVNHEIKF